MALHQNDHQGMDYEALQVSSKELPSQDYNSSLVQQEGSAEEDTKKL